MAGEYPVVCFQMKQPHALAPPCCDQDSWPRSRDCKRSHPLRKVYLALWALFFLEVPSQWISQFARIEVLNSFFKIWSMVASCWPSCLWLLFFCIFQQAVESADLLTSSSSSNLNTPRRPPWQFLLSLRRTAHVKCIRNWLVCYEDEPLFWMSNLETNGFAQHCGFPLHFMGFQFGKTLTVDFQLSSLSKCFNAQRLNKQRLVVLQKPARFVGFPNR